MERANYDIRSAAKKAGVTLWMIAGEIGVSEATLTRKMRIELSGEDKEKMLNAIERASLRKEEHYANENT